MKLSEVAHEDPGASIALGPAASSALGDHRRASPPSRTAACTSRGRAPLGRVEPSAPWAGAVLRW